MSQEAGTGRIYSDVDNALQAANRRIADFIAVLAHELRNPLAPIHYALATIKKAECTHEQRKNAEEIIERQAGQLGRLLDLLLDVSSVTRGKLELERRAVELTVALGAGIEAARPLLDAKQHTLTVRPPDKAVRLMADPVRLAQVFSNLLINAAKYTDPGGCIDLCAQQVGSSVVVSLRDNGIGITRQMMPNLFTMFAQDQRALSLSEGGLGIGLALVQAIVRLHGGVIEAHSDGPGQGSEFVVRLPIGIASDDGVSAEPSARAANSSGGLRVLVVDDDQDAADSCCTLLELSGHDVRTAYTARQALELSATVTPDIIFADIGLPDVDGYELARRIRASPWGAAVTLVAVTGWGQEENKRRALEAGFNNHLTKPIEPAAIEVLLEAVESSVFERGPEPANGPRLRRT